MAATKRWNFVTDWFTVQTKIDMEGQPSPIFYCKDGWGFWCEAWLDAYGPYNSEEEAEIGCKEYMKEI